MKYFIMCIAVLLSGCGNTYQAPKASHMQQLAQDAQACRTIGGILEILKGEFGFSSAHCLINGVDHE